MPDRPDSIANLPLVPLPRVLPPERHDDAQGFRETFLLFVTDPALNGALRVLGATAFDMVLEYNRHWPHLPGILTPWEMQAALGDLRSLQGFVAQVGRGRVDHDPRGVDAELSALAEVEALNLGAMGADRGRSAWPAAGAVTMASPLWPPNATHRLTTRATSLQLFAWNREARCTGRTPAQFLAWAADFACSFLRAMREADTPEEEPPARDLAEVERRAREGKP